MPKKIPMRYAPDRRQVTFRAGVWSCCDRDYSHPVEAVKHLCAKHQLTIAQAEKRVRTLREAAPPASRRPTDKGPSDYRN